MSIKLEELLPEEISDETAYHLSEFLMTLASAVDAHYFTNKRRYCKEQEQTSPWEDDSSDPF